MVREGRSACSPSSAHCARCTMLHWLRQLSKGYKVWLRQLDIYVFLYVCLVCWQHHSRQMHLVCHVRFKISHLSRTNTAQLLLLLKMHLFVWFVIYSFFFIFLAFIHSLFVPLLLVITSNWANQMMHVDSLSADRHTHLGASHSIEAMQIPLSY